MLNKVLKTSFKLYLYHIFCVILAVLLLFPLFNFSQEKPYLFSIITTLIYIPTLYSIIWQVGRADSRKIPGFYPDKRVPLAVTGVTLIIPALLILLSLALKIKVADGAYFADVINGSSPFIFADNYINGVFDFLIKIWYIPFEAFLKNDSVLSFLLVLIIKPLIIFIGYELGVKRIQPDIKFLNNLIYKDKK